MFGRIHAGFSLETGHGEAVAWSRVVERHQSDDDVRQVCRQADAGTTATTGKSKGQALRFTVPVRNEGLEEVTAGSNLPIDCTGSACQVGKDREGSRRTPSSVRNSSKCSQGIVEETTAGRSPPPQRPSQHVDPGSRQARRDRRSSGQGLHTGDGVAAVTVEDNNCFFRLALDFDSLTDRGSTALSDKGWPDINIVAPVLS